MVKELGIKNVKFTGYVPEKKLVNLYKKCHLLVCASQSETQGMVVIESMSYGCPVLVSNRMGFKDFVKDGENGLLFNKSNELSQKALKILRNKKMMQKIIKNGYATAKKYSIENSAKKMEEAYKSLVE